MDSNIGVNPFEEEKPRSPLITLAIFGFVIASCCVVFVVAFLLFKPDQLSLVNQFFPSPTPTQTKTPTPTPTPNLTATQQVIESTATAQVIQALATDSISQWPVLVTDAFDSNKNKWPIGKDNDDYADITREVKDGTYNWDVSAKKNFIAWVTISKKTVSNFNLSADFKRASGSSQSDYGLVFREDADKNLYYFGIDDENFFVLLNYGGEWSDMIKTTKSALIVPGETNRLTVVADGSHFLFYINGQLAGEMTDDHVAEGTAALAVEMYDAGLQATFEIDNVELRAP